MQLVKINLKRARPHSLGAYDDFGSIVIVVFVFSFKIVKINIFGDACQIDFFGSACQN